jgi:hypothetical protein
VILDKKANIDDVNNALAEVSNELEKKASVSGVEALMQQQVGQVGVGCSRNWGSGGGGSEGRLSPSVAAWGCSLGRTR